MSLLDERMETFCRLDKTSVPDGYGGTITVYTEGAEFPAVATKLQSAEMEIAYQRGEKELYAIYCKPSVGLEQNDRLKRMKDGKVFRVTAAPDPFQTIAASAIGLSRTTMEVISV